MAVTSTNRKAGPFLGNGTTTVFPFNFKVFLTSDLYVLQEDPAGNLSILTLGTDYTAVLNANQDVSPGGSVTLTSALANAYRMTITSDVAELQQVILTNLGGFYPDTLNTVFDRLTILIQQLQVLADRSIKFGLTDDLSSVNLPTATERAGKFLYFGGDGAISLVSASPIGTAIFSGELLGVQDGTNCVFTLTNGGTPLGVTPLQALVWKNFPLIQNDTNGFILGPDPGQVTFAQAPASDDALFAQGAFSL